MFYLVRLNTPFYQTAGYLIRRTNIIVYGIINPIGVRDIISKHCYERNIRIIGFLKSATIPQGNACVQTIASGLNSSKALLVLESLTYEWSP